MSTATTPTTAKLVPHEKGAALLIDPTLLRELGLEDSSAVQLTVSGRALLVTPLPTDDRRAKFEAAKKDTFEKYDDVFRKLAE